MIKSSGVIVRLYLRETNSQAREALASLQQSGLLRGATMLAAVRGFGETGENAGAGGPSVVEFFDRECDAGRSLAALESALTWSHAVILPATLVERSRAAARETAETAVVPSSQA